MPSSKPDAAEIVDNADGAFIRHPYFDTNLGLSDIISF